MNDIIVIARVHMKTGDAVTSHMVKQLFPIDWVDGKPTATRDILPGERLRIPEGMGFPMLDQKAFKSGFIHIRPVRSGQLLVHRMDGYAVVDSLSAGDTIAGIVVDDAAAYESFTVQTSGVWP